MADKRWMDQHFGPKTGAQAATAEPASSGVFKWFAVIAIIGLLVATVVLGLDYTGTVRVGVVERLGIEPMKPASSVPAAGAVPSEAGREPATLPDRAPSRAAAGPVELFGGAEPTEAARPSTSGKADAEIDAAVAPSAVAQRRNEREESLRRGVDLMERELAKIAADEEWPTFQVTIRQRRSSPYSAAERVKMADDYLRKGGWTQAQLWEINDERQRSVAQVKNAHTRLKELARKRESINARMTKARSELGEVAP
jgi:hypothetical protein